MGISRLTLLFVLYYLYQKRYKNWEFPFFVPKTIDIYGNPHVFFTLAPEESDYLGEISKKMWIIFEGIPTSSSGVVRLISGTSHCSEIVIYHKYILLRCRQSHALVSLSFRTTGAITRLHNKPLLHVAHTIQLKQHSIADVFPGNFISYHVQ